MYALLYVEVTKWIVDMCTLINAYLCLEDPALYSSFQYNSHLRVLKTIQYHLKSTPISLQ